MHVRLPVISIAVALSLVTVASAASADGQIKSPVLRDCSQHARGLLHAHSLASLRRALDQMPLDLAEYSDCAIDISSQIAGYVGRPGSHRAGRLIDDCAAHGSLRRRYAAATLRRASATLPPDVEEYGTCAQAITSQLSLRRKR